MFCIWCGSKIKDSSQFCPYCGGGQAPDSPPPSAPPEQTAPQQPGQTTPRQPEQAAPQPAPEPPVQPAQAVPPQQPYGGAAYTAPPRSPKPNSSHGPLLGVLIAVICIMAAVIAVLVLRMFSDENKDSADTPPTSTVQVTPSDAPSDAAKPTAAPSAAPSPTPSPTPTPTPTPTPEPTGYYVLPDSDSRYLTEDDLRGLSSEDLRIARNEIYARHGRMFNDEELQAYFDQQPWYEGTIAPEDFTQAMLNDYEIQNASLILEYENGR